MPWSKNRQSNRGFPGAAFCKPPSSSKSFGSCSRQSRRLSLIHISAAVIWLAAGGSQQTVTAQDHKNPTVLAYTSDDAIGFAKGEKMIGMYLNEAQDEEQHRQIANGLSLASPYIGSKNYVELDNGDVVYLPMTFETTAEMVGDLRVKKTSGEEEILDEAANLIYCSNGLAAVSYTHLRPSAALPLICSRWTSRLASWA